MCPDPGQPYRLTVVEALAQAIQDRDTALVLPAQHSDRHRFHHPTPTSTATGQPPTQSQTPSTTCSLKESVVQTTFTEEQAKAHWPRGIAIGKLNLVRAENRDPRLVLDSTICGVNPGSMPPARTSVPAHGVRRAPGVPARRPHRSLHRREPRL